MKTYTGTYSKSTVTNVLRFHFNLPADYELTDAELTGPDVKFITTDMAVREAIKSGRMTDQTYQRTDVKYDELNEEFVVEIQYL